MHDRLEILYNRRMDVELERTPLQVRLNTQPRVYHCEPEWHWAPSLFFDHDLWYVAGGQGEIHFSGKVHPLHSGICFVFCPGDTVLATQDPKNRLVVFAVHFDPLNEDGEVAEPLRFPGPMAVRDMDFFLATVYRMEALAGRPQASAQRESEYLLRNLLFLLWDEARNPPAPGDQSLQRIGACIRREPGRRWLLDEMAREAHLSRAQFVRRFRAAFGQPPARFVAQTRLERARQLLVETDMTLEQIAAALGYGDAAHFSRQFKQWVGASPGAVRRGGGVGVGF